WWNPYGVIIAVLGVLFTILTIIAATIIFLQGRSAKKLLEESIERNAEILNEYIAQKNEEIQNLINEFSQEIESLKEQAPETDDRQEFLNKLEKLENRLKALSNKRSTTLTASDIDIKATENIHNINSKYKPLQSTISTNLTDLYHTCSKCGNRFLKPASIKGLTYNTAAFVKAIKCPECGKIDFL
ncbi:MAG: hypothetical protein RI573_19160, partial [Balneolaceae bacterium]|nr:hypothetical protein [Balneolaceae bacterium]